jgi:hypothetical protein
MELAKPRGIILVHALALVVAMVVVVVVAVAVAVAVVAFLGLHEPIMATVTVLTLNSRIIKITVQS